MLINNNKKTIFVLLILFLFIAPISVYADGVPSSWRAVLHVEGEFTEGVNDYEVTIGVNAVAETLPAPPAPPEYSVKMDMFDSAWAALSKDIRQKGEQTYKWVIGIDPHGNVAPFGENTSVLSWDPSELGEGHYELRSGYYGTGNVVVSDMEMTTSYYVKGKQSVQYFTVVFEPY